MTTKKQKPTRGIWLSQNDDGYGCYFSAACEARTYLRNKDNGNTKAVELKA